MNAVVLASLETRCYLDLAIASSRLVAKGQRHFLVFNLGGSDDPLREAFEDEDSQFEIEAEDLLFRISLSKDGRYLLANTSFEDPRIDLFDLNRKEIVKKYRGHRQQLYLLKCEFGGVHDSFVVCGSEDGVAYVWSREKGEIIQKLGDN